MGTLVLKMKMKRQKSGKTHLTLLTVPITLTIISTSLAQKPCLAAVASDKKKRTQKTHKKTQEALSSEQLRRWAKDLPVVSNRIAYTEILSLKRDGKLKHVIKSPSASLRQKAEPVLVVLEGSRVLRTVLPSLDSNRRFWESWDELKIDSLCVNAYMPPLKKPEVPTPYLGFLGRVPASLLALFKPKKESKRAVEIRRAREAFKRQRKEEMERAGKEREMIEKAMKLQKKEEERMRREIRKRKYEESLQAAMMNSQNRGYMWANLAQDNNVATMLGVVFFVIFYWTVVLSYRRQKKHYEDRLKIENAEVEERRKMGQLERELDSLDVNPDELEDEGGEDNPYLKMAQQFMKSGAHV